MNQTTKATLNRNTTVSDGLKTAIADYEKSAQAVRDTRKLRAKLQSQCRELQNTKKNHAEPDMKTLLLGNDGEFNASSEQALFTSFMAERKIQAIKAALIDVEERLLRELLEREEKANTYASTYMRDAQPYIENEITQLIEEIKTCFSARVGQVLGLHQACKIGMTFGQNEYDVPEEMTLKYRVIDEVEKIFKQDWTDHALNYAGDHYIGALPDAVIHAMNNNPTPAQLKRAETDESYRASLLNML
ncbi:hypothetical protein ACP179_18245 [Xenorhabdus stockiae]|uniref:hypothetical protein n=1 Tax=Xenorhabdus stockiae TaxID=351614 RepID=UPI003CE86939